jgi:hypothetical protein
LSVALLATLTASATDFWLTKDWRQWSKRECGAMLADSPWARTWKGGRPETLDAAVDINSRTGLSADSGVGEGDLLRYTIQLRSSLPARQAIVRPLQLDQKYDKMTDARRSEFDAQAARILDRNFGDTILVHVDFAGISTGASGVLAPQRYAIVHHKENLRASLLTENGTEIKASRVDVDPAAFTFDAVFPRLADGAPAIKNGQKQFSFRFQSPLILLAQRQDIPAQTVQVRFDLDKMVVNGNPNF